MASDKLIAVLPRNYRSIVLHAIGSAKDPRVLINRKETTDFSEAGPLTQKNIRALIDLEIRDGATPILGFHDHPDEMWVSAAYSELAKHCESQGWLKIQWE